MGVQRVRNLQRSSRRLARKVEGGPQLAVPLETKQKAVMQYVKYHVRRDLATSHW